MKCKQCNSEFEPKRADARFCGKKCRALHAKRNQLSATIKRNPEAQPDRVGVLMPDKVEVKILNDDFGHVLIEQPTYATRTNPDNLNYGDYMTSEQLADTGLKANRVPTPGDSDYNGVCELIDGKWVVRQGVTC
jgi:hypothetical protein